jgi:uncharacterized protein YkwD
MKFPALFLVAVATLSFAAGSFAQAPENKTKSSVAAFVRDSDLDAGVSRPRVVSGAKPISDKKKSVPDIFELEREAFAQVNAERAELGIGPVEWCDACARVARVHSENMSAFGFFSHRGRDGKMVDDRADSLGLSKWTAIGENIAYNRGFPDPISIAVEKWLESPSHRQNLLSPRWRESGIGIAIAADGTYYFTQVFIVRK